MSGGTPRELVCPDSDSKGEATAAATYRLGERVASCPEFDVLEVIEPADSPRGRPLIAKRFRTSVLQDVGYRQRLQHVLAQLRKKELSYAEMIVDGHVGADETFLICERLEGESLAALLARRGRLNIDDVRIIVRQVTEALSAAHGLGVVHGDLTTTRILIERAHNQDGAITRRIKVRSFGLARPLGRPDLYGSPRSLAPEQINPIDLRPTSTQETDQFALAVITFELLTGRRMFPGGTIEEVAHKLLRQDPPYFEFNASKQEIERANQALQRALAKSPEQRFRRLVDFSDALALPQRGSVLRSLPASRLQPLPQPASPPVVNVPPPMVVIPVSFGTGDTDTVRLERTGDSETSSPPRGPSGSRAQAVPRRGADTGRGLRVGPSGLLLDGDSQLPGVALTGSASRRWQLGALIGIAALVVMTVVLQAAPRWRAPTPGPPPAPNPASQHDLPEGPTSIPESRGGSAKPQVGQQVPQPQPGKKLWAWDARGDTHLRSQLRRCVEGLSPRPHAELQFFSKPSGEILPRFVDATESERKNILRCLQGVRVSPNTGPNYVPKSCTFSTR